MKFFVICTLIAHFACVFSQVYQFHPEDKCSQIGGICVDSNECALKDSRTDKDRCPLQSSQGAVCCGKIPDVWTSCTKRGGECVPDKSHCFEEKIDKLGQCQEGQVCCIF